MRIPLTLAALSPPERAALERAVRETGLGIHLRVDETLAGGRVGALGRFGLAPLPAAEGRRAQVRWDGAGGRSATAMTLEPFALRDGFGVATLVSDASGRPVAQWRPMGIGRVGASLLAAPSRWLLEGERAAFDGYWARIIARLARPRPAWTVEDATPAFVDQPLVIARSGEIVERAVIEQPDGSRDTAYLRATIDSARWSGTWRPRLPGRHRILGSDTAEFDVRDAAEWPALRAARRSAATSRAALESARRTTEEPVATPPVRSSEPTSPLPFFLTFVVAAGWLWWERRAPASTAPHRSPASPR